MKKFLLFSIFPLWLLAQPNRPTPIPVSKDPTTVCHNTEAQQYNYNNNNLWACSGGATPGAVGIWTLVSSGGGTPPPSGYSPNQGISGCGVEYVTGLTFAVGKCTFTVGGLTWVAPALTVTSAAADATNPRIDQIVASITSTAGVGLISIQKGTAATPPAVPIVDYSIQIPLTHYTIAAMATTPTEPVSTLIYDETGGSEWTATASTHLNCSSTSNPYHLTKDCEATAAVITNNITYVKPAAGTVDLSQVNSLVFYIRSKAQWPTGNSGANAARSLTIFWLNGSTQKGIQIMLKDGAFGFISSNTTSYQQVSIPIGLFQVPIGTLVTSLEIMVAGPTGTASIGFYIDEITIQSGQVVTPSPVTFACVTFVLDGAGSVLTTGDLNKFPTAKRNGTIVAIDVSGNPSGSATMDIWKRAGAIPTSANKISASAPATLSSSTLNQNGSLVGWTLPVNVGDVWGGSLVTASTLTSMTVQIWCQ